MFTFLGQFTGVWRFASIPQMGEMLYSEVFLTADVPRSHQEKYLTAGGCFVMFRVGISLLPNTTGADSVWPFGISLW